MPFGQPPPHRQRRPSFEDLVSAGERCWGISRPRAFAVLRLIKLSSRRKKRPLIADSEGNRISGQTKYLRLKIKNRGKTFAKNVSLCVTQVTYKSGGVGEKTFPEEVFELRLAQTETGVILALPVKGTSPTRHSAQSSQVRRTSTRRS
jgi:hypothetical protein